MAQWGYEVAHLEIGSGGSFSPGSKLVPPRIQISVPLLRSHWTWCRLWGPAPLWACWSPGWFSGSPSLPGMRERGALRMPPSQHQHNWIITTLLGMWGWFFAGNFWTQIGVTTTQINLFSHLTHMLKNPWEMPRPWRRSRSWHSNSAPAHFQAGMGAWKSWGCGKVVFPSPGHTWLVG